MHEEQSAKREMKDGREGSGEAVGKGEISTLLTGVPGLATVRALGADVAVLVTFEASLDAGAATLVELVTEGVLDVVGIVLEAVLDVLVVALFRAHAGAVLRGACGDVGEMSAATVIGWADCGAKVMLGSAGAEGVGSRVEGGLGDGTFIAAYEVLEACGGWLIGGKLVEEFVLVCAKAS